MSYITRIYIKLIYFNIRFVNNNKCVILPTFLFYNFPNTQYIIPKEINF